MTPLAKSAFDKVRLPVAYRLHGRPVFYIAKTGATPVKLLGRHSQVRNNKELRDGGFALLHDFICRIRKSELPTKPLENGDLQVGLCVYRIGEVLDHPWSGEWKLGLRSATS
jgi:hypothetical protein